MNRDLVKRFVPEESPLMALSIDAWLKQIGAETDELWHYQAHLVLDLIYSTHYTSSSCTAASHPSWGTERLKGEPPDRCLWLGRASVALGSK